MLLANTLKWKISPLLSGIYDFYLPVDNAEKWMTWPTEILSLTLSGEGELHLEDGRIFPIDPQKHFLYYLPAGSRRFVKAHSTMHMISYAFSLELGSQMSVSSYYRLPLQYPAAAQEKIIEAIQQSRNASENVLRDELERERLLHMIIGNLFEFAEFQDDCNKLPSLRCLNAVTYLNSHFAEQLDIGRLARMCFMSKPLFYRQFRKENGMTAGEYMTQRRLQEVQRLLLSSSLPVSVIADRCGWHDPFHFSRLFTRSVGISPSKFRVMIQNHTRGD